ncbi:MAG: hypothetical protein QM743_13690 [Chitinophagaceae bacterium]
MKQEQHKQQDDKQQEKNDQFPGYPHYPASEDITNPANGMEHIPLEPKGGSEHKAKNSDDTQDNVSGRERKDLSDAFQNRDYTRPDAERPVLDQTDEDGDPLNEASGSYGRQGADLDVPGNEADESGAEGAEDEENNYYSLGGDNHEDLEEDNA